MSDKPSDKPPVKPNERQYDYRLKSRIDDLEDLLDHLGIDGNVTLVLHDWGGPIGMGYAVRHPERIRRIVLLNTAAFFLPKAKPMPWQLWMARNLKLGALMVRGFNAFSRGAARMACVKPMTPEVRRAYLAPYNSWKNRIATLRFVQDIPVRPGDPSYAIIAEIQKNLPRFREIPVLICWGERDFVFDRAFLDEWRSYLPQAEVHCFADAGHYVLEDASDRIIPIVRKFLQDHGLNAD